jgi:hypothetical protein
MDNNVTANQPKPSHSYVRAELVAGLVIICLAGGAFLAWHHYHKTLPKPTGPYAQVYKKLDNYKTQAVKSSKSMSYQKPAAFTAPTSIKFTPGLANFSQIETTKSGARVLAGGLLSDVSTFNPTQSQAELNKWYQAVNTGNYKDYQSIIDGFKQYISIYIGGYDFNFSAPQKLTTKNLTQGAISMDFRATPKADYAKVGFLTLQGRAVLAQSTKANYFFVIFSTDGNWEANQPTWDAAINSLKIDQ